MDALRALAKQPASDNRNRVGEYRINEYLYGEEGPLRSALERLRNEIAKEGDGEFWIVMQNYVQTRLNHLADRV